VRKAAGQGVAILNPGCTLQKKKKKKKKNSWPLIVILHYNNYNSSSKNNKEERKKHSFSLYLSASDLNLASPYCYVFVCGCIKSAGSGGETAPVCAKGLALFCLQEGLQLFFQERVVSLQLR
jgi:hypothetical protein